MKAIQQAIAKAKSDPGPDNTKAWFAGIVEMVDAWRDAASDPHNEDNSGEKEDDARQRIQESVLSVEVRSGWYSAGEPYTVPAPRDGYTRVRNPALAPAEFNILLSTGGPALRLIGELNELGEPETARLEWQDWGTPWTEISPRVLAQEVLAPHTAWSAAGDTEAHIALFNKAQAYLLDFARQFYFGEG